MYRLRNQIMNYAWGSYTAISGLSGRPPSSQPEAEVWMGAHPKASSFVELPGGPVALTNLIASSPNEWLGQQVNYTYTGTLPYLFKILAAAAPLSLQAHPSIAQAVSGYQREDAAHIPLDAPHRNYRDRNHKPELICALTRFETLCGFRARDLSATLFHELHQPALTQAVLPLFSDGLSDEAAIKATFANLMLMNRQQQRSLVDLVIQSLPAGPSPFASSYKWAHRLAELYPGDVGVVSSLLLNQVTLNPGQALYLPAGNLHAYLEGLGVELMANSDNVLRGGCTPKHVDVNELLKILTFRGGPIPIINPSPADAVLQRYVTDAREFELSRVQVTGTVTLPPNPGPRIVLVARGSVVLREGSNDASLAPFQDVPLEAGQSAYLLPNVSPTLQGNGLVFLSGLGQWDSHSGDE